METLTLDMTSIGPLTDNQLFRLCLSNKELRIERTSKGELVIMSPTGLPTSRCNSIIISRLFIWNETSGLGQVFESNAGFSLKNGAMRAPDAAWLPHAALNALSEEQLTGFPLICPDFVVELMSASDRLSAAQSKMEEWMVNGCRLSWLVDPETENVYIYRADGTRDVLHGFDNVISGEDVLPGFELRLSELR